MDLGYRKGMKMEIIKINRTEVFMWFLVLFGMVFCLNPAVAQVEKSEEYIIGPKDLLEIEVFGLSELDTTTRVSEDGLITVALLGEVKVGGLTKSGLEKKLTQLFKERFLKNPQVTVFIKEYRSRIVSILGAVNEPGDYELLGRQTLLQMISQAGGLTEEAGREIIVIRKQPDGSNTSQEIPVEDLVEKGDVKLNIVLKPGDIINIPIDKTVRVYVFGQVKKPGALEVKKSNIPTLLQAIAQAGGFSERASRGNVNIKRKNDQGEEIQITVNAKAIIKGKKKDIQLLENDVVYVPESIF
jgi:polysaccharide export outer membrane protein